MESQDPCTSEPLPVEGEDRNRLLAALYREHGRPLWHFLLGLLRQRAEADEVLQQVFLDLLESWDAVDPQTAKGWLYTVAYHKALARRRRQQVDEAALSRLLARPVWQCGSAPADPAARLDLAQQADEVRRAVEALPAQQQEIVRRRIYQDQTFAAIAREIGAPLGTVLSRMRLAVDKLRQMLENLREP